MAIWYKSVFASKQSDKVLIVDFDDTIARDEYPDIGSAMPGVKEALAKLKDAGFEIVIYTCRMTRNDGKPAGEAERQRKKIESWLDEQGIPFSRIEEGRDGKPHGRFYIDNKALHYGGDDDWESIAAHILSKGA